jgi:hypothetical protein
LRTQHSPKVANVGHCNDSRTDASEVHSSNVGEVEFSEVHGYKRALIWVPRLPLPLHTSPARSV